MNEMYGFSDHYQLQSPTHNRLGMETANMATATVTGTAAATSSGANHTGQREEAEEVVEEEEEGKEVMFG